jgi:hypothetical protein
MTDDKHMNPLLALDSRTYPDPSIVFRSIVLVGAMTKNGILCLAARTAALYVPIYPEESFISCQKRPSKGLRTLLAVSPFLAILSAPTTRGISSGAVALRNRPHTDGVDFVMLE